MTADRLIKPRPKKRKKARAKKPHGRPPHEATTENKNIVRALCGFGLSEDAVADYLDIDAKTLRKYYSPEMRKARPTLMAMASGGLFEALQKKEAWAVKWVHSTLGKSFGWTERTEHTGKDGDDLFKGMDLTKLDAGNFQKLVELLQLAGVGI